MLREAEDAGTELGREAASYMNAGKLVPDDGHAGSGRRAAATSRLPARLPARRFSANGGAGRGARRDAGRSAACRSTAVLELQVDDEELVEPPGRPRPRRTTSRKSSASGCDQYERQTAPLSDYYRQQGMLRTIDGGGTPDEVFGRIRGGDRSIRQKIVPATQN